MRKAEQETTTASSCTRLAGRVLRTHADVPDGPAAARARTARILDRVRAIPAGFVRTYGDIDPKAPRLVGRVLATTTERVPWHRVVRADGSMAMGEEQLARLRREGVPVRGGRVDLRRARVPG
ncbi:MAG TPA: MGMT family protein [Acidimicrobiales bacterium]|nr:MGMT family protein [Acidimicrobiales bacterium]